MKIRVALLAVVGSVAPLFAAPTAGPINAAPSSIQAGVSTSVTFTVQLSGGTVVAGGVNLLQETATGGTIAILGVMHDDSNDGTYTLVVPLTPAAHASAIYLQVSAAFKGVLLRVKSPVLALPVVSTEGSPTITDFSPKSGPIGTLITASLSGFTPAQVPVSQVTLANSAGGSIPAPVSTSSANSISFVVPDGAATGKFNVSLGANIAASAVPFTVTTSATFTLNVGPTNASLLRGQTVTYSVTANSTSGFDGLAALAVTGLPNGLTSSFKPSAITSGQTSILTIAAPANQPIGTAPLTIAATANIEGQSISQTAPANLQIVAVTTSFLARTVVNDRQQTPITGVSVKFTGKDASGNTTGCAGHTVSDAAGNVALTNLDSTKCIGPQLIAFDGSTATSPAGKYAGVNLTYPFAPGQATTSPVLINLPRIDNGETVQIQQNSSKDQTFTFQTIPGLVVNVYAGTKFSLEDGSQPNPFPLVALSIPLDRLPDKIPVSNMTMPFVVAFQPANAVASQPVAVTYPNPLNLPPASHATLVTLDPTHGFMVPYGTATVSGDGTQFIADADPSHQGHAYGLVHFDWHATSQTPASVNPCPECLGGGTCARSCAPIDYQSGLEVLNNTDISIQGTRGSIRLVRTYRTLTTNPGPFGIGTSHSYNYELDTLNGSNANVINLFFPDGNTIPFAQILTGHARPIWVNRTIPALAGSIMTANSDNTMDLRWKDGTVWHFTPVVRSVNSGSFLSSITDANGNVTTITYSGGQIAQVTDPVGRSLKFVYDGGNRITSVTDPIGRKVQYTYNSQGTLESVTDPENGVTKYEYDAQNRLTKITDPRNTVTVQNEYDSNGRVGKQTLADGGVTTFVYYPAAYWGITCTDPCVVVIGTLPIVATYVTDPLGNVTLYTFDSAGFLQSVTDASGHLRTFTRQPGTNLITGISGIGSCAICGNTRGGDQIFTYDVFGNITFQTDSLGNTTSFTYDPTFNKIASVTDPTGQVTHFGYDLKGNLISQTDPNNNKTSLTYDSFGELTEITDSMQQKTSLEYDYVGNLVAITDPLKNKTQIVYDGISRSTQVIDALARKSTTTYDNLGRIVSQTDPLANKTQLSYDRVGNLLSLTDAKGNQTTFTYDGRNRLLTRTDALSHGDLRTYDFDGNLIKFVDRRSQASVFQYDLLNRLIKEQYDDGSAVSRLYDATGRLAHVADSLSGSFDYSYDLAGRLLSSSTRFGQLQYTYDKDSRISSRGIAGEIPVNYTYDNAGNLASAVLPRISPSSSSQDISAGFSYDADNRLSTISRPNSVSSAYAYDAASNLLSITHAGGAGVNIPLTYTYDAAGNRTSLSNPLAQSLITQPVSSTFDNANRLVSSVSSAGSAAYFYDRNGNLASGSDSTGATTYTWDARNRLASITQANGQQTTFLYDWSFNLLQQTDSGPTSNLTQQFLLDPITNIARLTRSDGDNLSVLTGTAIDQDLAGLHDNGQVEYGLKDGINSTVETVDETGTKISSFQYEPFGKTTTASLYPSTFTGRFPVSSSLYYYRTRFYSPSVGRFIGEDRFGFAGGPNLYAYTTNSPVMFNDPFGRDSLDALRAASKKIVSLLGSSYGATKSIINAVNSANNIGAGGAYSGTGDLGTNQSINVNPLLALDSGDPNAAYNLQQYQSQFTNGGTWVSQNQLSTALNGSVGQDIWSYPKSLGSLYRLGRACLQFLLGE